MVKLKALLKGEDPSYNRGDKIKIVGKKGIKKVSVRNVYSRKLEDLTFNDLNMLGYNNPNKFVKKWSAKYGSFDSEKKVWVVVYTEDEEC